MKYKEEKALFGSKVANAIILFLVIAAISVIARVILIDTTLVLENSIFLFRFVLGILIVLIAKYLFGISTFGLFGPTVLVVTLQTLGLLWGLVVFLNIFVIGYIVRSLISPYNLAIGFRIGILMIVTISLVGLLEIIGETFLIPVLSGAILVPILITPWFIDRFVKEIEEKNHLQALFKLAFTLVVSVIAYFIMSIDVIVLFIALNPEMWVVILGLIFYFGRSTNYNIKDRLRFNKLFKKKDQPLSIQIRNRNYIAKYNSTILHPIINKFNMKDQFETWRVPTAELYAIINDENQLRPLMVRLQTESIFQNGFVVKPSQSFGGKGILVVKERTPDGNFVCGGEITHPDFIKTELMKILHGEYLTSQTSSDKDIAIIEEKIINDPNLSKISIGLPDIRVIVFRGIPVMAMARLSTKESEGKANLKQGAIGAAISIKDGIMFHAEIKKHDIQKHPDTGEQIVNYQFDSWKEMLAVSCLAQKSTCLGYAGVDLVVNEKGRILVLEVNKRPGLEIQNINQSSLLRRFEYIEKNNLDARELSPIKAASMGIELAQKFWEVNI